MSLRNLRPIEAKPYNWEADELSPIALRIVLAHCAMSTERVVRDAGRALEAHFTRYPLPSPSGSGVARPAVPLTAHGIAAGSQRPGRSHTGGAA